MIYLAILISPVIFLLARRWWRGYSRRRYWSLSIEERANRYGMDT